MRVPPLRREAIAPREGLVYLNHAAAGVLPRRTRDAIVALVDGQGDAGILGILAVESHLREFRERIGAFIGARGDGIAFLRNTGGGANTIARGFPWRPGDEIVICDNEFGSNACRGSHCATWASPQRTLQVSNSLVGALAARRRARLETPTP